MKLVIAIVNHDDAAAVASGLTKAGFTATKLATTGGFLRQGNTTFLVGTEDEKVSAVIDIVKTYSSKRSQVIPDVGTYGLSEYANVPIEVSVGGATVFVVNVERLEKL